MIRADRSALSRVLRDLIIIPHLFRFVKGFFKSFLSFFQELFSTFSYHSPARRRSARVLYHILLRLSRGFSKVFSTFFVILFRGCPRGVFLVDSLHIIALLPPFVNRFFESFFGLGSSLVCHKNVVAVLCILSNVRHFFSPVGE